jgi:hypothetical protein
LFGTWAPPRTETSPWGTDEPGQYRQTLWAHNPSATTFSEEIGL